MHIYAEDWKPILSCRWCHLSKSHPSAKKLFLREFFLPPPLVGKTYMRERRLFKKNQEIHAAIFFFFAFFVCVGRRAPFFFGEFIALRRMSVGTHGVKSPWCADHRSCCSAFFTALQSRPCESRRAAWQEYIKTTTWNLIIIIKLLYFVNSTWKWEVFVLSYTQSKGLSTISYTRKDHTMDFQFWQTILLFFW